MSLEAWRPGLAWTPQPVCIHYRHKKQRFEKMDRFSGGAIGPIFSDRAVNKLRPLLERNGHILQLDVINADEKCFLWWVSLAEDSVNYEKSGKYSGSQTISKFAFVTEKIEGLTAFRPHYDGMYNPCGQRDVYVSEEFKEAWLDAGLTGIEFRLA
ncbi:MAG: hypothetical protein AAF231_00200 [Pseudomonadota bacterium]